MLAWVLPAGCDSRPHAPQLSDTPVYQNKQAGFRFLVPDGWKQTMSAEIPPGPIEGEFFIVRYTLATLERGAALHVMCYEEASHPELAQFHSEPSFSIQNWKATGAGESLTVNGVSYTRLSYLGGPQNQWMSKEVVGVVRGGRVYCFAAVFAASDDQAREQVRRAIGSLKWDQ